MKPILLIGLYVFVVFLPLLLAWASGYPPRPFLDELATGMGLLSFSIILIEFILSGRFRSVSRKIGMDVTMRWHQILARTALVLVLFHPFLYQAQSGYQRPWDVTRQSTLTTDFTALSAGVVAWVLLFVLIIISIARDQLPYKYETWRLMHGVGALLIAAFALYHTLYAGRYSQQPALSTLWIIMFSAAVFSLLYVYLIKPILHWRNSWQVSSVKPIATKTWEVCLEASGHDGLGFDAGQFAWIKIGRSLLSLNENPFSISSAPANKGKLEFVIKELGDFTSILGELKVGTKAYVDGPHGSVTIKGRKEPGLAMIAGGIGIAPMLSILRQLKADNDTRPNILIYGNRIEDQIIYHDELEKLAPDHGTKLIMALSHPHEDWTGYKGMIDHYLIDKTFGSSETKDWLYILCGPSEMMESVEENLIAKGIPSGNILSERFDYD